MKLDLERPRRRVSQYLIRVLAALVVGAACWESFVAFAEPPLLSNLEPASAGDIAATAVGDFTTIVDHGPSSNRWDLSILGDGYTKTQQTRFHDHADKWVDYFFSTEPFRRYQNFFNVHRIDLVSAQSGADIPPEGIFRDTALNSSYYWDGVTDRLLSSDESRVQAVLTETYAGISRIRDSAVISVNHTRYGGAGGQNAVFAGGNDFGPEVALHEMGHSMFDLADEYGGDPGVYPGGEPSEPNVTADPSGNKWAHWIGYQEPGMGTIGAYEGARYYEQGIYRPSQSSKMRDLGRPFDAVSREAMILRLYGRVDPLDDWTPNDEALFNPKEISVDLIDPAVLEVEWQLDGQVIATADEQSFKLADHQLAYGEHTLTARAFDPTDWVRIRKNLLEETVSWTLNVALPGDANLDQQVDLSDFGLLKLNFGAGDTWAEGDFDSSGAVDLSDFGVLKQNFGQSAAAVPEPATWLLAGWSAVALLARARSARRERR